VAGGRPVTNGSAGCPGIRRTTRVPRLGTPGDRNRPSCASPPRVASWERITVEFEIYFNDDQSECVVLERYKDSESLIEHGAHIGDLMEAIVATGSVSGELLGDPSEGLRANLAPGGPVRLFAPHQSQ
jgi:hypothetical protein